MTGGQLMDGREIDMYRIEEAVRALFIFTIKELWYNYLTK